MLFICFIIEQSKPGGYGFFIICFIIESYMYLYLQRSVFQFARKTLLYSLCSALNCTMNHTDGINFCVVHAKLQCFYNGG